MRDVIFRSTAEYRELYRVRPKPIKGDMYYKAGVELARKAIKEFED